MFNVTVAPSIDVLSTVFIFTV
jgi:hypothetical protein